MKIREKRRPIQNKGVSVKIRETWQVCHMQAALSLAYIVIYWLYRFLHHTKLKNSDLNKIFKKGFLTP